MELSYFDRLKHNVASQASAAQILEFEDVVRVVMARQFAEVPLARGVGGWLVAHSRLLANLRGHCSFLELTVRSLARQQPGVPFSVRLQLH